MEKEIIASLRSIEQEYEVKVLFACESGSRAWGFPSKDSDWDVRFLYVHRPDVYMSIDPVGVGKKRDVIERPIHDLLDVSGWDLTKALKLFRKSNPPLLEWLSSDIVYEEAYETARQMRQLSGSVFSPAACIYHYINMAENNYRSIRGKNEVKLKKYFYVLRAVLAAKWIAGWQDIPPLSFDHLLNAMVEDDALTDVIGQLLARKRAGEEWNSEPAIPLLDAFLEKELAELRRKAPSLRQQAEDPTEQLNELFQQTVKEVWAS